MHDLPNTPAQNPSSLAGWTIAFDLDGTLVETAPDLVGALNALMVEEGLPPLPYDEVRVMVGKGVRWLVQRGFAAAGEPLDEARLSRLFGRFIEIYTSRIAEESRPYPGCLEALDALSAAGATLAVCTNKLTDLSLQLLDALEMTRRFAVVVGGDAAPAPKPDPRHIEATIAAAGGVIGKAIMVGDSSNDIDAARAAQVPSIAVTFGYTEIPAAELGAEVVIDHYKDLFAACQALSASCPAPNQPL